MVLARVLSGFTRKGKRECRKKPFVFDSYCTPLLNSSLVSGITDGDSAGAGAPAGEANHAGAEGFLEQQEVWIHEISTGYLRLRGPRVWSARTCAVKADARRMNK